MNLTLDQKPDFLGFPDIPPDRIAQSPRVPRDAARLLVVHRAEKSFSHRVFRDLPDFMDPGDALILNDVKVLPARLVGKKPTGGRATVLLLARFPKEERWTALVTPRPRPGAVILFPGELSARVEGERPEGEWELVFSGAAAPLLGREGIMPLPPYIKRPAPLPADREMYQTVYARTLEADSVEGKPAPQGAVAAPTAGLHFTPEILDVLRAKGVRVASLTLWVGWGTFRPIAAADYRAHRMLPEPYRIPEEVAAAARAARAGGKKVWAVGTTAVRALESAADEGGIPRAGSGVASLFITPGHRFRAVDRLVTNFHLPRHTPLLLAAAFAGEDLLRRSYEQALARDYQFLSYGDAMAIL